MKSQKIRITLVFLLVLLLGSFISSQNFLEVNKNTEYPKTEFLPTLENTLSKDKNAVYCVTLLYAWQKVRDTLQTTFEIPTKLKETQKDLFLLNASTSFQDVLEKNEYTVKATIKGNTIKTESEFEKSLPFEYELESFKNELVFEGVKVASFGVFGGDEEAKKVIEILYYENDDEFILKLNSEDRLHEVILFKTQSTFETFAQMNTKVQENIDATKNEREKGRKLSLANRDEVVIPKFDFDIENNFTTIEGNKIRSVSPKQNYIIKTAWQRIAFMIDEKGAKAESNAKVILKTTGIGKKYTAKPKSMRFDKPFFILLKKTNSKNAYFTLLANNAELMVKE
jgi:hypothetical protein